MGDFRVHKRLRLFKGLWLNLSKRGGSLSIGGHGLTTNISSRGIQKTISALELASAIGLSLSV